MLENRWKTALLIFTILLLIFLELTTLFLVGPISLTQEMNQTADLAHFLTHNMVLIRILLLGVILVLSIGVFKKSRKLYRVGLGIALLVYGALFYIGKYVLKADKLFHDPETISYSSIENNSVPLDKSVLGVVQNGEARAYPLEILAYHHKINDEIGGRPVLATYCIWCRSGRVFDPVIDGNVEIFRLVGMTEYNAVLEDQTSKSWWQQATGNAIAGKKKGATLKEIYSEQMQLGEWVKIYPKTKILQPDTLFQEAYEHHSKFVSRYNEMDSVETEPWEKRSWIIGVQHNGESVAIDYLSLIESNIIQDSVGKVPITVVLEKDTVAFHVWDSRLDSLTLGFQFNHIDETLKDIQTGSIWNMNGTCVSGPLAGATLQPIQAYEEYWHSWQSFHPDTRQVPK